MMVGLFDAIMRVHTIIHHRRSEERRMMGEVKAVEEVRTKMMYELQVS